MADQELSLEIRPIEPGDKLTGLSLGEEFLALKTYLQRHAKNYHEQSLAKTYGAFLIGGPKKIIGYITLVCGEIVASPDEPSLLDGDDVDYRYPHYPAIKIARLAVDRRYRDFDIGTSLITLAVGICQSNVRPHVGCRFIIVDAKKSAVSFYEKQGFSFIDTKVNKDRDAPVMFIDLQKAKSRETK